MQSFKKSIKLILLNLISFFFILELVGFLFFNLKAKSIQPAFDYFPTQRGYRIPKTDCYYASTLRLHPYFSTAYGEREHCGLVSANEYGFIGQEFPQTHDDRYYTILIVGASVAEQVGIFGKNSNDPTKRAPYLEEYLNQHWTSPGGKPFKVLNGSVGGTFTPASFMVTSTFLNRVDHVVSISGYNDRLRLGSLASLEEPQGIWTQLALADRYPLPFTLLRYFHRLMVAIRESPVRYSYSIAIVVQLFDLIPFDLKSEINTARLFPRYPPEKANEKTNNDIVNTYVRYLQYSKELCLLEKKKFNAFFQPSLFYAKTPVGAEIEIFNRNNSLDRGRYIKFLTMVEERNKGLIESMAKLYEKYDNMIYEIDPVHPNDFGLTVMSEHIADRLAALNSWRPRREN